jgi:hypothetical protein
LDLLECIAELERMRDNTLTLVMLGSGRTDQDKLKDIISSLKEISKNFDINKWEPR